MHVKALAPVLADTQAMQDIALSPVFVQPLASRVRPVAAAPAAVFLPKEHGSWSLALEPLALGLLVAPSPAGAALAAAALAGFFARRPFKAAFAPVHSERRREAREALCLLMALAVAGGFEMLVLGDGLGLWPLLLVVPFGLLFAYFDAQGEGRAAAAEVAGSAAFAVLPAMLAALAGRPAGAALALAVLALVRSVPAVLTLRIFLRQRKGEAASPALPLASAAFGVVAVTGLARAGLLPWVATAGALLLWLRTAWLVSPWRPAWPARRAGMFEAALGIAYVAFLAWVCRNSATPATALIQVKAHIEASCYPWS